MGIGGMGKSHLFFSDTTKIKTVFLERCFEVERRVMRDLNFRKMT